MISSNEHLVHERVAERLAEARAYRARRIADERPAPRAHETMRRIRPTLALPLHPTRKGTPA